MDRLIKKIQIKYLDSVKLVLTVLCFCFISCDKDEDKPAAIISVPTGLRLIHSSAISEGTKLNLYVDDVKITAVPLNYNEVSPYLPIAEGNRKISVKTESGTVIKDTVLNVTANHRYSVFVKEWNRTETAVPPAVTPPTAVKNLVIADDFNTTTAEAGRLKLRFVNAATTGNNFSLPSAIPGIFQRINPVGSSPATDVFTFNLVHTASDFLTLSEGAITLSATAPNTADVQTFAPSLPANLVSGKLYTVYLTGSPGGISVGGATIASSLMLKIIENTQ